MKQGSDLIERYEDKTKTPSKRKPAFNGTFSYLDLVRRDWRCFRVDTLVELDRDSCYKYLFVKQNNFIFAYQN